MVFKPIFTLESLVTIIALVWRNESDVFSCAFVMNFLTVRPLHIVHGYLVSDIHLKTK